MVTAIGLTAAVGIYSWRHRSVPGAAGFSFISFFWVLKLMASTLGLTAGELPSKVFWFQIEGLFLLPAMVASLAFALEFAGLDTWLNRWTLILLAIPALLFIPLSFTDYYTQHLISAHDWLATRIRSTPGVFGYVFLGYGLLVDVATLTVLIWLFIRSTWR